MDKKLGGLFFVFFLLFGLFATVLFFNQPISRFTRAREDFLPSAAKSLVFAYPLLLKADGTSKSTINVFVRSEKGLPVKDQTLVLSTSVGDLETTQLKTDTQGKASVTLSSASPGVAQIEVLIGGTQKINQTLSVKFE